MRSFFEELKRRNVIRVAIFYGAGAWLILQVGDVVLEIADAPEGSLRLIAIILALGFPFALILAWAFEITPEGIKLEKDVDRSALDSGGANRKLDIATMGLLTVAILILAWSEFSGREPRLDATSRSGALPVAEEPRNLSIAVLPFVNMSIDPENEYFSEGLSEELLNVLARIDDFRVAGRTSSFAFKGQQEDLRAIGERLGVANILEGSVRKQGNQIRVTAQLIDARSGYHLWSDTYDRRLDDVFALQDEIATEVVKALRRTLLAADEAVIQQTAKGDVEAYNHYLRGQFHVRLRTRAGLERALEEFQQASLIDPDYAPPYAGMAMVYALLDNYSYRSLAETGEFAHRALDRALALDPQSDEAWAVRGLLLGQGPGAHQRRAEARAALERAVEINPNNALAQLWLAGHLYPDLAAARSRLQRAYDLDPLSPVIVYRRAMEAMQERDEVALARFQAELEDVAPDWFMTWRAAGTIAQERGEIASAALALERAVALNPELPALAAQLAFCLEMLGYREEAERTLEAAARLTDSEDFPVLLAGTRARGALEASGADAALRIMRPAVEAFDRVTPEHRSRSMHHAELAMLEASAGEGRAAEARLRRILEIGRDELPLAPGPDTLLEHLVFAVALAAQERREDAALVGDAVQALMTQMAERGMRFSYMPVAHAYLDFLAGREVALDDALRESIREGYRGPPVNLAWLMGVQVQKAELAGLMAIMEEALRPDREQFRAARST